MVPWTKFTPPFPDGYRPERYWVQLVHKPTDRGTQYELDAWTDEVASKMVEFKGP